MKFASVVLFVAGAYAAADWNALAARAVSQISDGQVQAPTGAPSYPAGNATVPAATGTVGTVAPSGSTPAKTSSTGSSPTNAADSMNIPIVGAGLAGIAALLAL